MSISTLAKSGSHSVDKLLGNAFLIVKEVQENIDYIKTVSLLDRAELANLLNVGERLLLVPSGEVAPEIDPRDTLKGKILGVSADGERIIGVGFNGTNVSLSTPIILHGNTSLDVIVDQLFGQITVERNRLGDLIDEITTLSGSVVDGATSTADIDTRLTQLALNFQSLNGVIAQISALQDGQEGLSTLIVDEQAARVEGDTAIAATLQLIGAKNGTNDAFILDLDQVRVSPTESFAERFTAIKADTDDTLALIQQEASTRASAIEAEVTSREQLGAQIRGEFGYTLSAAVIEEQTARVSGDEAEATAREALAVTLRTESSADITAAVLVEKNARIDGDTAEASARTTLAVALRTETDTKIGAAVSNEASVRLAADEAEATARQSLGASLQTVIDGQETELTALIVAEQTARVTAVQAEATTRSLVAAEIRDEIAAGILSEQTARVDEDSALASTIEAVAVRTTTAEAAIVTETIARTEADSAIASQVTSLNARTGSNEAEISRIETVATGAQSSASSSAFLAASYRDQALGSANDAAGHAGTIAGQIEVATTKATIAAEQAVLATNAASTATTKESLTASYATEVFKNTIQTMPSDFATGGRFFASLIGPEATSGAPDDYLFVSYPDTPQGRVLRLRNDSSGYNHISIRKRLPVVDHTRRWKLTARVRLHAAPPTGQTVCAVSIYGLTGDYLTIVYSGHLDESNSISMNPIPMTADGSIYTHEIYFSAKDVPTPDSNGNTAAYLVPGIYFTNPSNGYGLVGEPELLSMKLEDVTESSIASNQASISTTQAAAASASASTASTASSLSATYRDTALSHRDAAAGSASAAAGRVVEATTQANIATDQAVIATDKASSASISQSLSASFSTTARDAAQQAHPTTFENQGTFFAGDGGGLSNYNNLAFVDDATYGPTARHAVVNGGYGVIAWKGRKANDVNKKWKVRALVRSLSAEVGHMQLRLEYYSKPKADGTYRLDYQGADQYNIASTTPFWIEAIFDSTGYNHPYACPALVLWGSAVTAGSIQEVLALEMIDISSELAAASSASIASTQATNATSAGSTASTQANISASFAGKARAAEAKTSGIDFSNLSTIIGSDQNCLTPSLNDFVLGTGHYIANDATDGPLFRADGNNAQFVARQFFTLKTGATYRISNKFRIVQASTSAYQPATYSGFVVYGATGAPIGNYYVAADIYTATTGWNTRTFDVHVDSIKGVYPAAVYISTLTIMNYRDEQPVLNSITDMAYMRMSDVTAELAASLAVSKANIATSQATTATDAATSATTASSISATYRNEARSFSQNRGYLNPNAGFDAQITYPWNVSNAGITSADDWAISNDGFNIDAIGYVQSGLIPVIPTKEYTVDYSFWVGSANTECYVIAQCHDLAGNFLGNIYDSFFETWDKSQGTYPVRSFKLRGTTGSGGTYANSFIPGTASVKLIFYGNYGSLTNKRWYLYLLGLKETESVYQANNSANIATAEAATATSAASTATTQSLLSASFAAAARTVFDASFPPTQSPTDRAAYIYDPAGPAGYSGPEQAWAQPYITSFEAAQFSGRQVTQAHKARIKKQPGRRLRATTWVWSYNSNINFYLKFYGYSQETGYAGMVGLTHDALGPDANWTLTPLTPYFGKLSIEYTMKSSDPALLSPTLIINEPQAVPNATYNGTTVVLHTTGIVVEDITDSAASNSSANIASSQAASASAAASTATTQAALSAAYAGVKGNLIPNGDFESGPQLWSSAMGHRLDHPDYGGVWTDSGSDYNALEGSLISIDPTRRYRAVVQWAHHTGNAQLYAGFSCYTAGGSGLGNIYFDNVVGQIFTPAQTYTKEQIYQGINASLPNPTYTSGGQFPPNTAKIKPLILSNYSNLPDVLIDWMRFELFDITESSSAASSASVATTQAATATGAASTAAIASDLSVQYKDIAAARASDAAISANAASGSATTATGAASTATQQAGLSANFATDAKKQVAVTLPYDFAMDGAYWAGQANTFTGAPYNWPSIVSGGVYSFITASNEGKAILAANNTGSFVDISPQGAVAWQANRRYRISSRQGVTNSGGTITGNLFLAFLNDSYGYISNANIPYSQTYAQGFLNLSFDVNSNDLPSNTRYVRPFLRIDSSGNSLAVTRIRIEDITESSLAASSASVASSQAATATAAASTATDSSLLSASYRDQAAGSASTAAGSSSNAGTQASNAAISAANASDSAASASTSTGLSASYRDTALTYATAAKVGASEVYPSDFSQDGKFFTQFYGTEESAANIEATYGSISYVNTANGRVARYGANYGQGSYSHTNIRKRLPIAPNVGRWFRITAKARLHSPPTSGSPVKLILATYGLTENRQTLTYGGWDAEYSYLLGLSETTILPTDGSVVTGSYDYKLRVPTADVNGNVPAFIHPGMYFLANDGGLIGQCDLIQLKFEDITEQKAAKAQAEVATSQASIASSQATIATDKASSASSSSSQSAIYRDQAGVSASGAAGSASGASGSASNAAGSASGAAGSASGAAGSAGAAAGSASSALISASNASSSESNASSSAASALSSATLSASITPNSRAKDPYMTLWSDSETQVNWISWNGPVSRVAGFQAQYSAKITSGASSAGGRYQSIPFSPGWWVEEMEVTLNAGTLRGVGVHTHSYNPAATNDYSTSDFHAVHGDGVEGRTYRITKLREWTASCSSALHYAMTKWSGFTGPGADISGSNDITIRYCGIRPATPAEIRDQTVLAPLQATVSTQATAITDLQGKTAARWVVDTVAGNNRAQLKIYADANTGAGVDIIGDVSISGNLLVGGSVNTGKLGANAATNGSHQYIADAVAMSTNWQDAATVTVNMIGGAAKIDFACYIAGMGVSGGGNIQFRLLRNGSEIRVGTLCLLPGEQTVYGGYIGDNPQSVYTPIAGMFPFFVLDTSGTTGNVTYTAQIRSPSGSYSYCDFAERQMSVTEFRR